ncbi:toxin glutamine deamidase domain-containing protein [Nocardia sp. JMUB6875]|uniref:toxin glutamine deamidase domain-containing protein n=1 Tax=Nocardia sp. JMUB6875 TaxID=3158170 RepID=UPI0034E8F45A
MNVDFGSFYAVGRACFGLEDALQTAFLTETEALADCSGMAGVDEAGVAWGKAYDQRVTDLLGMVSDLGEALEQLGGVIVQAGYNHYLAEYNSIVDHAGPPTAMPAVPVPSCRVYGCPPSAGGPSDGLRDDAKSLIRLADKVGLPVPDGDTGKLQTSADAWNRLHTAHSADLASVLKNAAGVLQRNDSEDAQQLSQKLLDLQGAVDDILGACGDLSTFCTDQKSALDNLRHEILTDILKELCLALGADLALTYAASFLTFGVSALVGTAATEGIVATYATRIAEAVKGWSTAKRLRESQVVLRDLSKSRAAVLEAKGLRRGAFSPAGKAELASLPEGAAISSANADQALFDKFFPELANINPMYKTGEWGFRNNCQSCVVSVEERLAGNEVTAVRRSDKAATDFTWPDDVLNAVGHGNSFREVSGYKEIEQQLLDAGPGSRGIVHGAWLDENGLYESGHVFNVINRDGKIFYVDGQTGTWADLHNYSGFEFLRTN